MDREEFYEKIQKGRLKSYEKSSYMANPKPYNGSTEIKVEWTVGGQSGGSCWGTEHYPRSAEPEPEFNELDQILEWVCPDIRFLQYKNLYATVVETGERTDNDYYGNYTNYAYKKINLGQLYNELVSRELI